MSKEEENHIKSILTYIIKNFKTPEIAGGTLILLLIYKYFYEYNFIYIYKEYFNKYSFIMVIVEFLLNLSIILSIISFCIFVLGISMIVVHEILDYILKDKDIYELEITENILDYLKKKGEGYLLGALAFLCRSISWMIISIGYLYILNETRANEYLNSVLYIKPILGGSSMEMPFKVVFILVPFLIIAIMRKFFYKKY